ncbi:carboxylesterase/lipase family protein [Tomitella fengzijianii]|uniref:Carboxylic ester hydrolase n=1 Tax=Tomitella fengzijianii TaxID=2597660 RepID=A0A516X2F6_9ACTN|nr:carboxylesterase/lipase family protein [Tomitella fengzijianii]QDQ97268.1 carboxylesterase/lipase family protein [Tomitella fengzijianii]
MSDGSEGRGAGTAARREAGDTPSLVVEPPCGAVRGHLDRWAGTTEEGMREVFAWRGIPYAAPPVGMRRFRAPEPAAGWNGVRDCAEFGPVCPQAEGMPIEAELVRDEDCLNLNVWAPRPDRGLRPVLVWIHGGAYFLGAGSQGIYRGQRLAAEGDAVVVTFNYRLGVLGFVSLDSMSTDAGAFDSNVGLRDQLAVLEWVRDNITAFGGDPDNVTVFGESSGGGAVTTLMAVPRAEGLFHRAIAQSSPATSVYGMRRAESLARRLLALLGVAADRVDELRAMPVSALAVASGRLSADVSGSDPGTLAMAPVVDGDLVPRYPVAAFQKGLAHRVPLIIGTNRDEASIFRLLRMQMMPVTPQSVYQMLAGVLAANPDVSPERVAAIMSGYRELPRTRGAVAVSQDAAFRMPAVWIAEAHSRFAPTWLYRFDHASPMLRAARVGAGHATEVPYVFGTFGAMRRDPTFVLGGRRAAERVAARTRSRWLTFARTGRPDGDGAADSWAGYDERGRRTLLIDRRDQVVVDPDRRARSLWGSRVLGFP